MITGHSDISQRQESWLVHLRVLARYRSLGLATLEEHVLVQGQPCVVLESGAHSVFTWDLGNEVCT